MMGDTKKYGLIISKKKSSVGMVKKGSVFGNESSDEEDSSKAVNVSLLREADKKKQMKQTQIEVQKALAEDPTVYEYDSVYDQMQEKKKPQVVQTAEKDKKPKYIKGLLKSAAERKLEYERQIERKAQREREAEGEEFADKDAFVTTAYKKKMQEWAEEEERLKRQDLVDAANDVTKQKDLSQFYRNLLNENVSMGGVYEANVETRSVNNKESEEARKERSHSADRETKSESRVDDASRNSDERRKAHQSRGRERHGDSNRTNEHRRRDHEHRRHRKHSNRSDDDSRDEETPDQRSSRRHDRNSDRSRRKADYHREERPLSSEKNRESKTDQRVADEKNLEKDQERDNKSKEKSKTEDICKKEQVEKQTSEEVTSKFAKRSTGDSVMSARERYLARKAARETFKTARKTTESDED